MMRSEVYVARIGETDGDIEIWWGHVRERNKLKDPHLDLRVILKWIFKK